ncbi:MAG: TonB-dependent receptor [Chitinophagaceae bacterium]|nr:TonB-dependent receptor [Chitinophagaceae bacterium]
MKQLVFFITACIFYTNAFTQNITQTIKGTITDKVSEKPLSGASITVSNGKNSNTISKENGQFYLTNINTGRVTVMITMIGYKTAIIPEVLVTAGKEVIVDVAMEQEITSMNDVVVKSSRIKKGNASNEFAGASSRSFSMEEVTRFAGGRNDPSKLVSSFAGVISSNDSRNDIVVRGNSPAGVLWRLEGLPTPSPNHFATAGTTGGPISALNTNALKTSDFYTGAFPAEYGNANAAVFDIQLRTGNAEKHEKTLQLNLFSGLEAMLEGPLNNKKNGASYLIGYRYSFVQIGQSLGLDVGTSAVPKYQDWVYNIQFAKGKAGKLNLFGMGGISNIDFIGKDTDTTDFYSRQDQDVNVKANFNVFGAKHTIDIGKNSYLRSALSYSTTKSNVNQFQYAIPLDYTSNWLDFQSNNTSNTFRFSSYLNTKFNAKLSWRNGVVIESFDVNSVVLSREGLGSSAAFKTQQDYDGTSTLVQAYSQARYKPTNALTLTGGLHGMHYSLNSTNIIEPRVGINYQINNSNTLLFNYGLHGQLQPLPVYLFQQTNGTNIDRTNRNLDFTKAHHFVVGYEKRLNNDWRIKAETYYQYLFDVPVENISSGFSMLNAGADFTFPQKAGLVNNGTGENYGIELTLERFLSKGFYVLTTGSIFNSTYKGSDGIERNTTFNYGYAANILAGREWKMGKSQKNAFTFDIKLTSLGGRYFTPVNLPASIAANKEVLDENNYNAEQLKGYFRLDTKFGFRINSSKRKLSHTFYIDLQNVTNNKNIFLRRYNAERQQIGEVNQIGFFPDILYRIQF